MDKELIERLATESGLAYVRHGEPSGGLGLTDTGGIDDTALIRRFAALIAEECAKVCDEWLDGPADGAGQTIRVKFAPP